MGYKPSGFEQAKFHYSPLGKIFNDELKKQDKKERLLKRIKNIGVKNEELLKAFSDPIKLVMLLKMKVIKIMIVNVIFAGFIETLKILKECQ